MKALAQYRKTIVAVLTLIHILIVNYGNLVTPAQRPLWTAIGSALGAFLVYLVPNSG